MRKAAGERPSRTLPDPAASGGIGPCPARRGNQSLQRDRIAGGRRTGMSVLSHGSFDDKGISKRQHAQKNDTAAAKAFETKFAKVTVGDVLTGHGGMSKAQVAALVGQPKPNNITETRTDGATMVTWSYDFVMSKGSMMYSVDFMNGHGSGKSSLWAKPPRGPYAAGQWRRIRGCIQRRALSSRIAALGRCRFAAATFSSRCFNDEVPGIGTRFGARCRSQASATCAGDAFSSSPHARRTRA